MAIISRQESQYLINSRFKDNVSGPSKRAFSKFEKVASTALKRVAAAGVVALGALTVAAVRFAVKFEQGILEVATLIDGITNNEIENMKKAVQSIRIEFAQTRETATKALFDITSAGFLGEAGMKVLAVAAKLAVAGVSDVAGTSDLLTSTLNAYQEEAKDAERVSDIFFATQKKGKTTITELSGSMGQVLPTAKLLEISLVEVGAAVATLTAGGISTPQSVTSLNQLLLSMVKPGKEAADTMKEVGIQTKDASGKFLPLVEIVRQFIGLDLTTVAKIVPSVEAVKALGSMISNFEKLEENVKAIGEASGATQKGFEQMGQAGSFALTQMKQSAEVALERIGDLILKNAEFKEIFENLKSFLLELPGLVDDSSKEIKVLIDASLTFLSALRIVIEGLVIAFKGLTILLGTVVASVAGVIGGMEDFQEVWGFIEKQIDDSAVIFERWQKAIVGTNNSLRETKGIVSSFELSGDLADTFNTSRRFGLKERAVDGGIGFTKQVPPVGAIESKQEELSASVEEIQSKFFILTTQGIPDLEERHDSFIDAAKSGLESYANSVGTVAERIAFIFDNTFQSLEDGIVQFVKNGELNFSNFIDNMITDLIRFQVQQSITLPIAGFLSDFASGFGGIQGTSPGALDFGGGFSSSLIDSGGVPNISGLRAGGGSVSAGRSFIVGEKGREVFTPLNDGRIIPNNQVGGGVEVNIFNNSDKEVQTQETQQSGGGLKVDVIIGEAVVKDLKKQGPIFKQLRSSFAVKQRTVSR